MLMGKLRMARKAIDSHDQLTPIGLCINGCLDGYSRSVLWLKVYHTNSDRKVIGSYCMELVQRYGVL